MNLKDTLERITPICELEDRIDILEKCFSAQLLDKILGLGQEIKNDGLEQYNDACHQYQKMKKSGKIVIVENACNASKEELITYLECIENFKEQYFRLMLEDFRE